MATSLWPPGNFTHVVDSLFPFIDWESTVRNPAVRPAIGTALLLVIPLVMSVLDRHKPAGDGWHWGPLDFVVMGFLLFAAGLSYEYFARRLSSKSRRVALGIAILFAVFAVWVELAVGGVSQLVEYFIGTRSI